MTDDTLTQRGHSVFIDGQWRRARDGETLAVTDPSTGETFTHIDTAGTQDVDDAVGAAVAAFPRWRRLSGRERAGFLQGFARGLAERRDALVAVQMRNSGKPRAEAEIDVGDAIATFDYYATLAAELDSRQGAPVTLPDPAFRGQTRFEPVGPVGMIVPWNFPLVTSAWKIAPALAAGCTVVLKTSEYTPLIELAYGDIAQQIGLPAGVLNLLTGAATVGAAITADARLHKLSFTGSNAVGARVMSAAAARCLPVSLELGGKSPIVVFADADIDHAVECILGGIFFNAGQMCSATSRLLLQQDNAEALLARLVERTRALKVGPPTDPDTQMGPITTGPQYHKVRLTLADARADGLRALVGGELGEADGGFFIPPTVYTDVPDDHPIWRDEIFGPVLAVRTFTDEIEATAQANDTAYGLVATVVTADPARAQRVAEQIDAGHIWINAQQAVFPQTAWGGFKASGIGRELGPWGLAAFQGVKHISTYLGDAP